MSRGTVIRIRHIPGGHDQYGDPIAGMTDELPIENCVWAPRTSAVDGERPFPPERHGSVVSMTLYPPPSADIRRTDQIRLLGHTYEVDGEVGDWTSPFSGVAMGGQVGLRRVEG